MELRDLIERISRDYDAAAGFDTTAQRLLRGARENLAPWVPSVYVVKGSGGQGSTAFVPWIAVFDPDETTSAQRGMYLVYLFAVDLGTVVLSLNQGVTDLVSRFGTTKGRERLAMQATAIREALPAGAMDGLNAAIDLPATAARPVHYRYGNIAAKVYASDALPSTQELSDDLRHFVSLYQTALDVREELRKTQPEVIKTTLPPSQTGQIAAVTPFSLEFKPKNDTEYQQDIKACTLIKTRKHETLVRRYGEFLMKRGFQVATNVHPRDMIAVRNGITWLIEAKMVCGGNGVNAAREALGQLLAYRYLHHPEQSVTMVALFSETIGEHAIGLLKAHDVNPIWYDTGLWCGSLLTSDADLCS